MTKQKRSPLPALETNMATTKRLTAKEPMDLPKDERYKFLADQAASPELIAYYQEIMGEHEIPIPAFCLHCGTRTALLVRHPDTGTLACLPCMREKEPGIYREIFKYTRGYPPKEGVSDAENKGQ